MNIFEHMLISQLTFPIHRNVCKRENLQHKNRNKKRKGIRKLYAILIPAFLSECIVLKVGWMVPLVLFETSRPSICAAQPVWMKTHKTNIVPFQQLRWKIHIRHHEAKLHKHWISPASYTLIIFQKLMRGWEVIFHV